MWYPNYVTKYFEPDYLPHYEAGSIRFGNVAEYRRAEREKTLDARGDEKEGVREFFATGIETRSRSGHRISINSSVHMSALNAHVFCCTISTYSEHHHMKMLKGDSATGYAGNPKLTCWCVFETRGLLEAVEKILPRHDYARADDSVETKVFWSKVRYDWDHQVSASADQFLDPGRVSDEEGFRALSTKRPLFSTEKEFRLIARARGYVGEYDPALILKDKAIRSSIISFGSL